MELWEVTARESIRDLVTRYNSNGDTGRFAQVLDLFTPDATMETATGEGSRVYRGREEISTIFTGTRSRWKQAADQRGTVPYIRHCVFTHQIDFGDPTNATGRSYFQVLMAHGLDHWGRYLDDYTEHDGRWLFARRKVTVDGHTTPA